MNFGAFDIKIAVYTHRDYIHNQIVNLFKCYNKITVIDRLDPYLSQFLTSALKTDRARALRPGEVLPVSAEQSQTRFNNQAWFGASRAIDLDWSTYSRAVPARDGITWFKVKNIPDFLLILLSLISKTSSTTPR